MASPSNWEVGGGVAFNDIREINRMMHMLNSQMEGMKRLIDSITSHIEHQDASKMT